LVYEYNHYIHNYSILCPIYIMSPLNFFILLLLAFILMTNLFFILPFKNKMFDTFIRACLFIVIYYFVEQGLGEKEGYANSVPFFKDPANVYDYCMEVNQPPFMASDQDTVNYCLNRVAGTGYVPPNLKKPKKVRFAC